MNLHANAALSLKGRPGLCLAVVERERTLAQAAEPTPDQRQSRTLHPHPPLRLGLWRDLPLQHRAHRRT